MNEFSRLVNEVKSFCDKREWTQFHAPKELAIGLTTESAELLDIFRFKSNDECKALLSNPIKRKQVEEELADILFFLLRFSQLYKVNLPDALKRKIAINKRKYPVRLVRGKNKKYSEYKE